MLYEDRYFGPNDYSIYGIYGKNPENRIPYQIQWKRANHILGPKPKLFWNEWYFDCIIQGHLGNCWFVCVLVSLIEQPIKIVGIFDLDESENYNGEYHIRLHKDGEVINVAIDDLIPCREDTTKPVFCDTNYGDLWILLLEKAYAKVYGCYTSLAGGFPHEAFMDLTGLPAFRYCIAETPSIKYWINEWNSKHYPMVVSTRGDISDDSGLSPAHCYTILRAIQEDTLFLINLRDPSGKCNWRGDFNSKSRCWTREIFEICNKYSPSLELGDGSFWMKYEDFSKYFDHICVCNIALEYEQREKIIFKKVEGIGSQAKNFYEINVWEEGVGFVLGLHQEDERSIGVKDYRKYLDLGFIVLSFDRKTHKLHYCSKETIVERDCQIDLRLPKGRYWIIPISSGTAFTRPNNFPKRHFPLITEEGCLHPLFQSTIKDIFRRTDIHMRQAVNYQEFMSMYSRVDNSISEDYYNNTICRTYDSNNNRLTLSGFYEFFMAQTFDKGEEAVRNCLLLLGYDDDFYSLESRAVVFTLHSTKNVDLAVHDLTEQMNVQAWMNMAIKHGNTENICEKVKIYIIVHKEGRTYLAYNRSKNVIRITTNFSKSKNVNFFTGSPWCENVLSPGSYQIVQHLFVQDVNKAFKCNYNVTTLEIN